MPTLKTATNGEQFRREAKDYVINMLSGSRKLHKKNCCKYSGFYAEYYDFDTTEEAYAMRRTNSLLENLNSTMDQALTSIQGIEANTSKIAENSAVIAHNSAVTAYYSKVNAELTNAMGFMMAYKL